MKRSGFDKSRSILTTRECALHHTVTYFLRADHRLSACWQFSYQAATAYGDDDKQGNFYHILIHIYMPIEISEADG